MTFASVYPHYITKVEKESRTLAELHQVIEWLSGFNENQLLQLVDELVRGRKIEKFYERTKRNLANQTNPTAVV